jgi:hypothetical protein
MKDNDTPDELLAASLTIWKDALEKASADNPVRLFTRTIDFSKPEVELGPDDFSMLMRAYAETVGIDVLSYGRMLGDRYEIRNEILKSRVGAAFRTVFEAEGYYVEIPSAFTLHKVPTRFLILMGAVLLGIATGKATQLNVLLGGAVGGATNLLINILATRYMQSSKRHDLTWTEEFVIKFLKISEPLSLSDLHKLTNLNKPFLKRTLNRLVDKRLVVKQSNSGGRKTAYSLKE